MNFLTLAERGFVTLAFDHRYYGQSEGQPREYERPETKVQNIKDAVTFLQSVPYMNEASIGGLGVCAGGAYMMQATVLSG